jgi:hypothetical protein
MGLDNAILHTIEGGLVCPHCGYEDVDFWDIYSTSEKTGKVTCQACYRPYWWELNFANLTIDFLTTDPTAPSERSIMVEIEFPAGLVLIAALEPEPEEPPKHDWCLLCKRLTRAVEDDNPGRAKAFAREILAAEIAGYEAHIKELQGQLADLHGYMTGVKQAAHWEIIKRAFLEADANRLKAELKAALEC